jgi:prepilin-type N-terminal cleavage/methylation domain-containing protein
MDERKNTHNPLAKDYLRLHSRAFTLIELLVVIAIIANPAIE